MNGDSREDCETFFALRSSIGGRSEASDSNLEVSFKSGAVSNDGAAAVSLWITKLWIANQKINKIFFNETYTTSRISGSNTTQLVYVVVFPIGTTPMSGALVLGANLEIDFLQRW
jgi:hypothetical protein